MILQAIISQVSDNPLSEFYFDTEGLAGELKPLDPFFTFSVAYNHKDDCWYFVIQTVSGVPNNRATVVYRVNSELIIEDSYLIPNVNTVTSTYDNHYGPVLCFDENGALYIAREKGKNGSTYADAHNTSWLIYKTDTPAALSTISLIKDIFGRFSYPNISVDNGIIFLAGRGKSGPDYDLSNFNVQKSNYNGIDFTSYDVYNTNAVALRGYTQRIANYDNSDLIFAPNIRNDGLGTFVSVHVVKSADGVVWSNFQENFSKDVSVSGAINKIELDANCLVWESSRSDQAINFEGGVFKDGKLRVLISASDTTGGMSLGNRSQIYTDLRLYTLEAGVWTYQDLSELLPDSYESVWALQRVIQLCWDTQNDYIYVIDKTGLNNVVKEYKSTDLFKNYTSKIIDERPTDLYFGSHSYNSPVDKRLLILIEAQGSIVDFNSSSNLILYKPK